jgi:molybdenum cofactor biosynthesis enzyme MoaA
VRYLEEAKGLSVKEYYFTGGEPFANPQMCDILELTLRYGSATVLTNATLLPERIVERLEKMKGESPHPLEIRVSLDGYSSSMNDPIRGEGTFDRAMEGTRRLVQRGFRPIITITRTWEGCDEAVLGGFVRLLEDIGYAQPRLKILPLIKLGAEVDRGGGYCEQVRITHTMMAQYDQSRLVCSSARLVTDHGVWVCPILPDAPEARMGDTLAESVRDYPLRHAACYTCWQHGAICSNTTTCTAPSTQA